MNTSPLIILIVTFHGILHLLGYVNIFCWNKFTHYQLSPCISPLLSWLWRWSRDNPNIVCLLCYYMCFQQWWTARVLYVERNIRSTELFNPRMHFSENWPWKLANSISYILNSQLHLHTCVNEASVSIAPYGKCFFFICMWKLFKRTPYECLCESAISSFRCTDSVYSRPCTY